MYTYIDSFEVGTFKEQFKLWETVRDMRLVGIEWLLGYEVVDLNAASSHICHTLRASAQIDCE